MSEKADVLVAAATVTEVAEVIVAFLNAEGGRMLIGVAEDSRVIGVQAGALARLQRGLSSKPISPSPRYSITSRKFGDRDVVVVDVPSGSERPYVLDDRIFVWKEGRAVPATPADISRMIHSRREEPVRWEQQRALGIGVNDLDERQLEVTFAAHFERGLRAHSASHNPHDLLEELNVVRDSSVLNAGAILFARSERALPQSRVRVAAFRGTDRTEFMENRLVEGNLFDVFDQIVAFFERRLPSESRVEALERRDMFAIPSFVIRESVMNALVHRDYSQLGVTAQIALHPDRVEIWNPGRLPSGVAPEDLAQTRVSRPQNPDIAHVAYLRGLVEQWGSGTGRIVSECAAAGLPAPEWSHESNGVLLKVYTDAPVRDLRSLSVRLRHFLDQWEPGEVVSLERYMATWAHGVSERTARADLQELARRGFAVPNPGRSPSFTRTTKRFRD